MDFSDDELRRLERLAALELGPEEHARMRADLARILEYVRALQRIDISDVPPTFHGIDARPPLRPDEVRESLSPEDVLRNAPDARAGFYRVPRFVGGGEESTGEEASRGGEER